MRLWLNQHEVAIGDVIPPEDPECDFSFGDDGRELFFGKGMKLPSDRQIGNLVSRVDNVVLLSTEVGIERLPNDLNVWDKSGEPYELFSNTDLISDSPSDLKDGFGWWTFENHIHSPHDDSTMNDDARFVLDFLRREVPTT